MNNTTTYRHELGMITEPLQPLTHFRSPELYHGCRDSSIYTRDIYWEPSEADLNTVDYVRIPYPRLVNKRYAMFELDVSLISVFKLNTSFLTPESFWKLEQVIGKNGLKTILQKNKFEITDSLIRSALSTVRDRFFVNTDNRILSTYSSDRLISKYGELKNPSVEQLFTLGIDRLEEAVEKGYVLL